jgi:enoyl-[acyl-carrier-protein] reductase (NADH)
MMPFLDHMVAYTEDRGIPGGATLEQVAKAVLYLASDASDGVTGIDVPVDGGATAGKWIEGFNTL